MEECLAFQPLMCIVNAFKRTKSICQHKSFRSSAVFSNSSFTISLLHYWEYTERTQGSLILLTHALESVIMQFSHNVFLYYSSLGSNKPGSQRTHLWLAERLSCTAWFSNKGSSLLPLSKELSRGKWKYYHCVPVNPEIMMQITWQICLVATNTLPQKIHKNIFKLSTLN